MYRPLHVTLMALVSLYHRFFPRRSSGPGPQMYMEDPPTYRHGSSSRLTPLAPIKYRRWRKVRMQMQRESRRRNRA